MNYKKLITAMVVSCLLLVLIGAPRRSFRLKRVDFDRPDIVKILKLKLKKVKKKLQILDDEQVVFVEDYKLKPLACIVDSESELRAAVVKVSGDSYLFLDEALDASFKKKNKKYKAKKRILDKLTESCHVNTEESPEEDLSGDENNEEDERDNEVDESDQETSDEGPDSVDQLAGSTPQPDLSGSDNSPVNVEEPDYSTTCCVCDYQDAAQCHEVKKGYDSPEDRCDKWLQSKGCDSAKTVKRSVLITKGEDQQYSLKFENLPEDLKGSLYECKNDEVKYAYHGHSTCTLINDQVERVFDLCFTCGLSVTANLEGCTTFKNVYDAEEHLSKLASQLPLGLEVQIDGNQGYGSILPRDHTFEGGKVKATCKCTPDGQGVTELETVSCSESIGKLCHIYKDHQNKAKCSAPATSENSTDDVAIACNNVVLEDMTCCPLTQDDASAKTEGLGRWTSGLECPPIDSLPKTHYPEAPEGPLDFSL